MSRDRRPLGADCGFFPPGCSGRRRPQVPCAACMALDAGQTAHGCPTHVWRCSRPGAGAGRDARARAPSQPRGPLSPSAAPGRQHVCRAPVRCRRGGGAAHVRAAWPRVAPAGPSRVPAEAVAHGTRRPEATPAWPRGQRGRSGISSWRGLVMRRSGTLADCSPRRRRPVSGLSRLWSA